MQLESEGNTVIWPPENIVNPTNTYTIPSVQNIQSVISGIQSILLNFSTTSIVETNFDDDEQTFTITIRPQETIEQPEEQEEEEEEERDEDNDDEDREIIVEPEPPDDPPAIEDPIDDNSKFAQPPQDPEPQPQNPVSEFNGGEPEE